MTAELRTTGIVPHSIHLGMRSPRLVRVQTEPEIIGWGESGLSGRERAVADVIEHYRGFVIGRVATETARMCQQTCCSQHFEDADYPVRDLVRLGAMSTKLQFWRRACVLGAPHLRRRDGSVTNQ